MDPAELERLVDQALRDLPEPRAPRSLLPRVMAAVEAQARLPWYAHPWLAWPREWQVVSAALFVTFAAAVALWLPEPLAMADRWWAGAGWQVPASFTERVGILGATLEAGRVLARTFVDVFAGYLATVVLTMFGAGVVGAAALNRMVLEGTWES